MPFPPQRPAFTLPPGVAAGLRAPAPRVIEVGPAGTELTAPTRDDIRTVERTLQAAAGQQVRGGSMSDEPLLKGSTAAELAGPLALMAMRRLEQGMRDFDPRVAFEAARVAATVAPKVLDLTSGEVKEIDPEAERAGVLAALATPRGVAMVLEVAGASESPVHVALCAAGWTPPT